MTACNSPDVDLWPRLTCASLGCGGRVITARITCHTIRSRESHRLRHPHLVGRGHAGVDRISESDENLMILTQSAHLC
jgi:hypothetical protein